MAAITVEIPDELLSAFGKTPDARQQRVLEAAVLDCYQAGRLSQAQCASVLKIPRIEFITLVAERHIAHPLSTKDLVDGYLATDKLFPK